MKKLLFALLLINTLLMAQDSITIQLEKDLKAVGDTAAHLVFNEINRANREQKNLTLILPTGSTPLPMYESIVTLFYEGKLDFSKVTFFNLDEYYGLGADDVNSYAYYMKHNLYNLITPKLTQEKLNFFGLKHLDKKDCSNKALRLKLNESIDTFCDAIVNASKENPNTLEAFEKCARHFKKNVRSFQKLYSEYMDDRKLPSLQSIKAWIEKDISLRSLAANEKNIHLIKGLANPKDEIDRYQKELRKNLDSPNSYVVCIAGIGRSPAHIAFNEFITEDRFLEDNLTYKEKNNLALKSSMRLVPLADGTKESNSRFFADNIAAVPHHALTLGLREIFDCDRIIVLAGGSEKKEALYQVFSKDATYEVPASLLKKYNKGKLQFIIDEKAYGLAEEKSLFSLQALNLFHDKEKKMQFIASPSSKVSFWHIPSFSKMALLDKGYQIKHKDITLASIPKKQTVLWIKEGKVHYSLWQELKENQNKVHISQKCDVDSILSQIDKHHPSIIILPYSISVIEKFSHLKLEIQKRYPEKPLLGIFYETSSPYSNVFFPLTKEEQKTKVETISKFHHTQSQRSKFDLIAEEMSSVASPISLYNETFCFFDLELEGEKVKLIPFSEKCFITKSYDKNKKQQKQSPFSFEENDVVTIIAPHPDDAEISAGALIRHLGRENIETHVLNATSGHNALMRKESVLTHPYLPNDILRQAKCESSEFIESKALKSRIRECESLGAISYLNQNAQIHHLRLPFYEHLKGNITLNDRKEVDSIIDRCTKKHQRLFFFLPYPEDNQPTHRKVYQLFMERIAHFYKKNSDKEIVIAFYPTPWTGKWNMYDYSYNQGSRLAALAGGELLMGKGLTAAKPETLGGIFAKRYQLFYFNK